MSAHESAAHPEPRASATPAAEALACVMGSAAGALATFSVDDTTRGFPFGSVVPFALDAACAPVILVSRIAQHTRNLEADPRASLLVTEAARAEDPQAGWRVTLVGKFERLTSAPTGRAGGERVLHAEELARIRARYLAVVPGAESYEGTHDFDLWAMAVVRVRYIGGFGRICWVEASTWTAESAAGEADVAGSAARIVAHMNDDHADALAVYCEAFAGFRPERAAMESVDSRGFFVRAQNPDRLVYLPFGRRIGGAEARHAFVELLKRARERIARPTAS